MNKIAGIMSIILAFKVLLLQDFNGTWSNYSFSESFLFMPVSLLLFYFGYLSLKYKPKKKIEYYKCPKCKEAFNYSELENGKCKYCEDIDTIDIEEYYEKYPKEKDV